MKEKNINYGLIIFVAIIVVLFIPIITDYIKNRNIEVLSSSEVSSKIKAGETFLVYVGDLEKDTNKELRKMRDLTKTDYSYEYGIYNVKNSNDIKEILGNGVVVSLYIEGDLQKNYTKYDAKSLKTDVEKYFIGKLTDDNRTYKVAENFNSYKKIVKSDNVTMAVFGRDDCFFCNKFKPVYNAIAEKYNLDIYYFASNSYNKKEYNKIVNMDLTVPGKCSTSGVDYKLSQGFNTPLTIFTKKGKVIDCISGYINRNSLVEKLKDNKIISE